MKAEQNVSSWPLSHAILNFLLASQQLFVPFIVNAKSFRCVLWGRVRFTFDCATYLAICLRFSKSITERSASVERGMSGPLNERKLLWTTSGEGQSRRCQQHEPPTHVLGEVERPRRLQQHGPPMHVLGWGSWEVVRMVEFISAIVGAFIDYILPIIFTFSVSPDLYESQGWLRNPHLINSAYSSRRKLNSIRFE